MNYKSLFLIIALLPWFGASQLSAQNNAKAAKDTVVIELPKQAHEIDVMAFNKKHPHVVSLNLFSTALLALPEIQYEYSYNESVGFGARASLLFDTNSQPGWGDLNLAQLQGFTRWHFTPNKFFGSSMLSSFFIEGMMGYMYDKTPTFTDTEIVATGSGHGVGLGAGAGWRLQSANGRWIGESSFSVGRLLVGNGNISTLAIFSGGIKIGYRF